MVSVHELLDHVLLDRNHALRLRALDIGAAIIIAALAALAPMVHGIERFALESPDADLVFIYEALAAGSGLGQEYFDHTGYLFFQLLAAWLKLISAFGIIPASRLTDIAPPLTYEAAFTAAIHGGRVLMLILAASAAVLAYAIARAIVAKRWLAFMTAALFAASSGLASQSLILRTELPSMIFVLCYVVCLLSCQRRNGWRGGAALMLAAFFAGAAVMVKIMALPIVILLAVPFCLVSWMRGNTAPVMDGKITPAQEVAILVSGSALALPGIIILWAQADQLEFYHVAVPGLISVIVVAFAILYRRPWFSLFGALGFIMAGSGLAFALNLLRYNEQNIWVLANLTQHARNFTKYITFDAETLTAIVIAALNQYFFETASIVMFCFAAPTSIWLYSIGQHRRALCIGAFLVVWIAILGIFSLRALPYYLVYFQIIPLLAALLAADGLLSLPSARAWKWLVPILTTGCVVLFIFELRTALGPDVRNIQSHERICLQVMDLSRLPPNSFGSYCS